MATSDNGTKFWNRILTITINTHSTIQWFKGRFRASYPSAINVWRHSKPLQMEYYIGVRDGSGECVNEQSGLGSNISPFTHPKKLPPGAHLSDNIPFTSALLTIVTPPVACCTKADIYIHDKITISLDDPIILPWACAAVLLAIHIVARPLKAIEPIPRSYMVAFSKPIAEGAMEKMKVAPCCSHITTVNPLLGSVTLPEIYCI